MKNNLITVLAVFFSIASFAQDGESALALNYKWAKEFNSKKYLEFIENQDFSYTVLDRNIMNYTNDGYSVSRGHIEHKIHYIGNKNDIEKVNRLYIYTGNNLYVNIKVRTITSNGTVVDLDESKMQDVSKEEGSVNYKILAISGIEEKSWVEVIVVKIGVPPHVRFTVDNPFPTIRAQVDIYTSLSLNLAYNRFEYERIQAYGAFKSTLEIHDTSFNENLFDGVHTNYDFELDSSSWVAENILPFREESYSHEYANTNRVDIVDLKYTWEEAGKGIGGNMLPVVPKYAINGRNWLRKMEIFEADPLTQIQTIEKFVKQEITETDSNDEQYQDTRIIWKKRIANENGILRMTDQLLSATGINYRVYLTCDKEYIQIDPEFAFTRGLEDLLFYFPDQDLCMVPTNSYYSVGQIPNYLASNRALIIKDKSAGEEIGKVVRLPNADKSYSIDGTNSIINIDTDQNECSVIKSKLFFGDRAIRSRGYYHFADKEERSEYIENLLLGGLEMELSNIEVKNEKYDLNFQSTDTICFTGKLSGSDLISSIPNGFILNPGSVIGIQTSFYDTEDRIADIYIPESKTYKHTIVVNIPDGYSIEGTENLEFYEEYSPEKRWLYGETRDEAEKMDASEPAAKFIATAEISDGQIRIEIDEFYVEGFYPKEGIEELQKVVNAAYEFFIAKIKFVEE